MKLKMHAIRVLASGCLVGVVLHISTASAAQNEASVIHYNGRNCVELKDENGWSVAVWDPGQYCIAQDLHQSWPLIRLPDQPTPKSALIDVRSGNVTVNLMGRHLVKKTPVGEGIWVSATSQRAIRIFNGSISTSSPLAVFMVQEWNIDNKRFGWGHSIASSHGDLSQYRDTEYILENLTLESDNIVIIMQGKKNIIRHCKIIGGNGTVNLYGPNMTFEDNEIILNAKDPQKDGDEPAVALYLEDAQDSVIRNNRITIKGRAAKIDAIVLKNSANVVIEGNTITGSKEVYKLLDEISSVKASGNTVKANGW